MCGSIDDVSDSSHLRLKKRSVKAILADADVAARKFAQGEFDGPIGFNEAQLQQLRSQIQLHTQLLAQSVYLCAVLPETSSTGRTASTKKLPHAMSHQEIAVTARTCLRQLSNLAGRSDNEKQAVANIILDLSSTPSPKRKREGMKPAEGDNMEPIELDANKSNKKAKKRKLEMPKRDAAATAAITIESSPIPASSSDAAASSTSSTIVAATSLLEADPTILFTPFDQASPMDLHDRVFPILQVPALGVWEDERFERLATMVKEEVAIDEVDKENATPLSSGGSLTSTRSPHTAAYTKSRAGRALLSLPTATVHAFWDDLVVSHQLDPRFLPKLMPHERHLFTVAEEHLFELGLQTLQWHLQPLHAQVATLTATGSSTDDLPLNSLLTVSDSSSTLSVAFRHLLLTNLRSRFLPAKSLKDLSDRLEKVQKKERAKMELTTRVIETVNTHIKLESPSAASLPAAAAAAVTTSSPMTTPLTSPTNEPSLASSIRPDSDALPVEPVLFLRDFTPIELALVTAGWKEFHAHRHKWSLISDKYLPAWPRKLLAKAWSKHHEKMLRTTMPHLERKVGRPKKGTSTKAKMDAMREIMNDEGEDETDQTDDRNMSSTIVHTTVSLYETMEDEGDGDEVDENPAGDQTPSNPVSALFTLAAPAPTSTIAHTIPAAGLGVTPPKPPQSHHSAA